MRLNPLTNGKWPLVPNTPGEGVLHAAPSSHFLHAGQVHVSVEGQSVVLILGSCVGVCLWDPISAIGGATHYLLPAWDGRGVASPRYGNVAIGTLVQKLMEAGARLEQLRAKVFGGGCLFDSMRANDTNADHLGSRNVQTALEVLTTTRILVVSTQAATDRGQRVEFRTDTGESSVKDL
jgi:chemotaxis protein CheD